MLLRPVSEWNQSSLQHLIDEKVEENDRLDYKRELVLDSAAKRAELCKDVSSFANSSGGRLIIGMIEEERDGLNIPVALAPLADPALKDRLVDALYSYCVPNVHIDPKLIEVDGGYCLAMEIPESIAPVFVAAKGHNRYYKRYDARSIPMHERDVQARYQRMLSSRDYVASLTRDASIVNGWPVSERPRLPWVSLVAVPAFGPVDLFNPATFARPDLTEFAERRTGHLDRLTEYRPTYFGLEVCEGSEPYWTVLIRLHRSGVVEYHHAIEDSDVGWVSVRDGQSAPPAIDLGFERSRLYEAVEVAEGLYRTAGYMSEVSLSAEYRIPGGWQLGSLRLYAPEPLSHSEWVSVAHLAECKESFVEAVLDRLAQASGLWSSRNVR